MTATTYVDTGSSGNPAFSDRVTSEYLTSPAQREAPMTRGGVAIKTLVNLVVLVAAGAWGWASATSPVATDLGGGYANVTVTIPGGFWLASFGAFFVGIFCSLNPRRAAVLGILYAVYFFVFIVSLFDWGWLYSDSFRAIGLVVTVFAIVLAALSLTLDFGSIDAGVRAGAPKFMEWYSAYGLMVTLIWLYLLILRLLALLSRNR